MAIELGRLERVELRNVWLSEPQHFTPWLALEENLILLAEALGLELELEGQEQNVGPFRADILCKDISNDHWVLIENQLERTDHLHLGQLLTYAAGLQAVTIVWIAQRFTQEHRAALDWLNEITDDRFNFFGLEIELWRIGQSLPSPKFNVICKPNNWTRQITQNVKRIEQQAETPLKQSRLQFWQAFKAFMQDKPRPFSISNPPHRAYMVVSLGMSFVKLFPHILKTSPYGRMDLYLFAPANQYFFQLYADKDLIEKEIGHQLEWNELPEGNSSVIRLPCPLGISLEDQTRWPELFEWYDRQLQAFYNAFKPRLLKAMASDED